MVARDALFTRTRSSADGSSVRETQDAAAELTTTMGETPMPLSERHNTVVIADETSRSQTTSSTASRPTRATTCHKPRFSVSPSRRT